MQTAGHFVRIAVKFTTGVQLGHDDLGGGNAFFGVDIDRDTAAIIAHRNAGICVDFDLYIIRMFGKRLVDAIIDDLIDHMVQTRAIVGVTNIHPGAFANRLQTLENFNGIRAIFFRLACGVGHVRFLCYFRGFKRSTRR